MLFIAPLSFSSLFFPLVSSALFSMQVENVSLDTVKLNGIQPPPPELALIPSKAC